MSAGDETVTIAEAAELTGVSKTVLRGRIQRGTLKAVKRGELRRIPVAELRRVGLLASDAVVPGESTPLTTDELVDRIERQARRIGQLEAETARLERELAAERTLRQEAERRLG